MELVVDFALVVRKGFAGCMDEGQRLLGFAASVTSSFGWYHLLLEHLHSPEEGEVEGLFCLFRVQPAFDNMKCVPHGTLGLSGDHRYVGRQL